MDRNYHVCQFACAGRLSLSARRAWIEIKCLRVSAFTNFVALRKESVDRNSTGPANLMAFTTVALRKESVDRNECDWKLVDGVPCRSPQGERGMFLFLTVQGGFVHADIRFNFKNCYSKKLSHKII